MSTFETKIRAFISDNFLFREDRASIADEDSLLDAGLIDSTGVLELVVSDYTAEKQLFCCSTGGVR